MVTVDADLADRLQEHVGDGLRTVASYERRDYRFHHLRDDVEQEYSRDEIEAILEDLVLQGMSTEYLESLFHAGQLECAIYGFEQAAMFHFVIEEGRGLFVSINRDTEMNLESVISTCKESVQT